MVKPDINKETLLNFVASVFQLDRSEIEEAYIKAVNYHLPFEALSGAVIKHIQSGDNLSLSRIVSREIVKKIRRELSALELDSVIEMIKTNPIEKADQILHEFVKGCIKKYTADKGYIPGKDLSIKAIAPTTYAFLRNDMGFTEREINQVKEKLIDQLVKAMKEKEENRDRRASIKHLPPAMGM